MVNAGHLDGVFQVRKPGVEGKLRVRIWRQVSGHHARDTPIPGQRTKIIVVFVLVVVVDSPAAGVGIDDRFAGGLDGIEPRAVAAVGQIDDHSQLVHPANHPLAEQTESRVSLTIEIV